MSRSKVQPICFSAPGSTMLLGEHAVLSGELALVAALDKRLRVCLTPRVDKQLVINSALGELQQPLTKLTVVKPFQFIVAAVERFVEFLPSGLTLQVQADFKSDLGLGSSAAVSVATLACLLVFTKQLKSATPDRKRLLSLAVELIREVQGRGSGADIAASVYGGVVAYRCNGEVEQLGRVPTIGLYYSGSKTPTAQVLEFVAKQFIDREAELMALYQAIGVCAEAGKKALQLGDWNELGECFYRQQQLMDELGVNTPELTQLIEKLRRHPDMKGVKISGSGLGDCVVALAESESVFAKAADHFVPARITTMGLVNET